MADVFGRRDTFLAAFVLFFGFSLGCGFARNLDQLIACRALQGIGGSGLYSLTMVIWPELAQAGHEAVHSWLGGRRHSRCWRTGSCAWRGPDPLRFVALDLLDQVSRDPLALSGPLPPSYSNVAGSGPIGATSMILFFLTWPKPSIYPASSATRGGPWTSSAHSSSSRAAVLVTFSISECRKRCRRVEPSRLPCSPDRGRLLLGGAPGLGGVRRPPQERSDACGLSHRSCSAIAFTLPPCSTPCSWASRL